VKVLIKTPASLFYKKGGAQKTGSLLHFTVQVLFKAYEQERSKK